jgi:hypothetical protein
MFLTGRGRNLHFGDPAKMGVSFPPNASEVSSDVFKDLNAFLSVSSRDSFTLMETLRNIVQYFVLRTAHLESSGNPL